MVSRSAGDRAPPEKLVELVAADDFLRFGGVERARRRGQSHRTYRRAVATGESTLLASYRNGVAAGFEVDRALQHLEPGGVAGLDFHAEVRAADDGIGGRGANLELPFQLFLDLRPDAAFLQQNLQPGGGRGMAVAERDHFDFRVAVDEHVVAVLEEDADAGTAPSPNLVAFPQQQVLHNGDKALVERPLHLDVAVVARDFGEHAIGRQHVARDLDDVPRAEEVELRKLLPGARHLRVAVEQRLNEESSPVMTTTNSSPPPSPSSSVTALVSGALTRVANRVAPTNSRLGFSIVLSIL